jgi:hypothetical protein
MLSTTATINQIEYDIRYLFGKSRTATTNQIESDIRYLFGKCRTAIHNTANEPGQYGTELH